MIPQCHTSAFQSSFFEFLLLLLLHVFFVHTSALKLALCPFFNKLNELFIEDIILAAQGVFLRFQ